MRTWEEGSYSALGLRDASLFLRSQREQQNVGDAGWAALCDRGGDPELFQYIAHAKDVPIQSDTLNCAWLAHLGHTHKSSDLSVQHHSDDG